MANLGNVPEDVVYGRDRVNAADDMNDIWAAIVELKNAILAMHANDGGPAAREFAHNATYEWSGSKYLLSEQSSAGIFPAEIAAGTGYVSAGVLDIPLTGLADRNYGVVVSGGKDSDNRPGQIGCRYDVTYKTSSSIRVLMTKNSATTAADLDGFTIVIFGTLA